VSHKKSEKCFGLLSGLPRTVSGINGDFRPKSPTLIFPPPCIYIAPAGIGPRAPQRFNPALSERLFILQNYAEPYKIYLARPELS